MVDNLLNVDMEALAIGASALALSVFAIFLALRRSGGMQAGSKGHGKGPGTSGHESIRADGYIDSFAGEIEEAGGGLTLFLRIVVWVVLIWWVAYIVYYWSPR